MRSAKPLSDKAMDQIDKPGWHAVGLSADFEGRRQIMALPLSAPRQGPSHGTWVIQLGFSRGRP